MQKKRGISVAIIMAMLAWAVAVGACSAEEPVKNALPQVPACGTEDDLKVPRKAAIVNGVKEPTAFAIPSGQQLAVGALMMDYYGTGDFSNICTGTLVAPTVVLTAAHCLDDGSGGTPGGDWLTAGKAPAVGDYRFAIGDDVLRSREYMFELSAIHVNENWTGGVAHDVAVLILAEDATAAVPGLMPVEVNGDDLSSWIKSKIVQNVGYGAICGANQQCADNSEKWWTEEPVVSVNNYEFVVDGQGVSSVCFGDSGGPSLYLFPDNVVRVIGTVSQGDQSCVDQDHFARVDYNLSWIESNAGSLTGCQGLNTVGECQGSVARWCENDRPAYENCADSGKVCMQNAAGNFRCEICQGPEALQGQCEEHVASWCENGVYHEQDCAASGQICLADAAGLKRCRPNPCGDLDWNGRCENDEAVWCEDYQIKRYRCWACNQQCGYVGPSLGNYCL